MSEITAQQKIRIAAPLNQAQLLRNNSGACLDKTGRMIRYGLGNDSAKINKHFKSSDLIGFQMCTITPDMIGQSVAVFMAIEVKKPGWGPNASDERENAQRAFGDWVTNHGGIFHFATGPGDIWPCLSN